MKIWTPLVALCGMQCVVATSTESTPEPAWGRLYLRNGPAPIQYFRDSYGGPMVTKEVEFYVPRREENRLGCELLPESEQAVLRASNGTIALVVDRGECSFEVKARNAETMGVAALVIVSEDESAKPPVALAAKGEIGIASVMIRKSGGDLLRAISAHEPVVGRLIPMVCERKPYTCKGRYADDNDYIADKTARSGVILAQNGDDAVLGEFLMATYGSVIPTRSIPVATTDSLESGCEPLDAANVQGKLVVLTGTKDECSVLERVSNAQRAGAAVALVALSELSHPAPSASWHAYNITIAAGVVSEASAAQLRESPALEVALRARNSIAETWDEIRRLAVKSAWPTRKERKEKLLRQLLTSLTLDHGQLHALKRNFLTVAGGNSASWDQLVTIETDKEASTHEEL